MPASPPGGTSRATTWPAAPTRTTTRGWRSPTRATAATGGGQRQVRAVLHRSGETLGYEDRLIIDREGNVAYSAYKSVDLGVNLREEPYASSSDQELPGGAAQRFGRQVVTTDFERYLPSLNVPTAWVMSPSGRPPTSSAVLAVQVPITQINNVMTGDQGGATGPGKDRRGLSRRHRQADAEHLAAARRASRRVSRSRDPYGTPANMAKRIVAVKRHGAAATDGFTGVNEALAGRPGWPWRPTTPTQQSGGLCPAGDRGPGLGDRRPHGRRRGVRTGERVHPRSCCVALAIVLAVSLLSLVLAQVFTRPINRSPTRFVASPAVISPWRCRRVPGTRSVTWAPPSTTWPRACGSSRS